MLFFRAIPIILISFLGLSLLAQSNAYPDRDGPHILNQAQYYIYQNSDSSNAYLEQYKNSCFKQEEDSLYANYLLLSGIYRSIIGEVDSALKLFKKSHRIYTNLNHSKGIAESLLNIGEVYYNLGKYDESLQYFVDAEEISREHAHYHTLARAMKYVGKYYHSTSNFSFSLGYYKKSLQLAKEISDTIGIIALNNKIGKHFETVGDYPKALECFLNSEKLIHRVNNQIERASTYNHLGNIYQLFQDFPRAVSFHRLALDVRKKMKYKEGVAKSLKNLGEVYIDVNNLDSALICFDRSNEICKEIGYAKGQIKNIHNQGVIYLKRKEYPLAIGKFNEALEICRDLGYGIGEIKALAELSKLYIHRDSINMAFKYANQGLEIAIKEDIKSGVSDFYFILYELYFSRGDYKIALEYFKKHTKAKDELLNAESNQKIAELQTQYEMSLQSRENEVLLKENQIQELLITRKNSYIMFVTITLILLLAAVVIVYGQFLQKKKANEELIELNKRITVKNDELSRLNNQLNSSKNQQVKLFSIISHELRNPLYWFRNLVSMLSSKIDVLDKEMISKSLVSINEAATNTFHLMDNLLHWSRSQLGNIKFLPEPVDLNKVIRDNIDIVQHYVAHKEIDIHFVSDDHVCVKSDVIMIQTVIRNLLSNAVKFTPLGGVVEINCVVNCQTVEVMISDNGVGMDSGTVEKIVNLKGTSYIPTTDQDVGSGMGLVLTKEFIELNGGKLQVESEPDKGSVFRFVLPLFIK